MSSDVRAQTCKSAKPPLSTTIATVKNTINQLQTLDSYNLGRQIG
jgi:serine/threonine protein kinase